MKPINFKESKEIHRLPFMQGQERQTEVPVMRGDGYLISCWTCSFWQRLKFLFHGKIWMGTTASYQSSWIECEETIFDNETN